MIGEQRRDPAAQNQKPHPREEQRGHTVALLVRHLLTIDHEPGGRASGSPQLEELSDHESVQDHNPQHLREGLIRCEHLVVDRGTTYEAILSSLEARQGIKAIDIIEVAIAKQAGEVDDVFVLYYAEAAPSLIEISLPKPTRLHVTLHDVRGRRLARVWDGSLPAGRHQLEWTLTPGHGKRAAGIYFLRADLGDRVVAHKFLLLR